MADTGSHDVMPERTVMTANTARGQSSQAPLPGQHHKHHAVAALLGASLDLNSVDTKMVYLVRLGTQQHK